MIRSLPAVLVLSLGLAGCGGGGSGTSSNSPPQTAATPAFSPAAGTYASVQSVTISDSTPGASIHYTIDGTSPAASSTLYSSPVPVTATTTIKAIAVASGYSNSAIASGAFTIANGIPISVVLSTDDKTSLMAAQPTVYFGSTLPGASANVIAVDETQQYQTIDGFGAAMTDSAAYLLHQVVPPANLSSVMSDLFTRSGSGIGIGFIRNPMGASDIARTVYSFDDLSAGQTDPTLASFSIAHDQADIIPLLLRARQLNPQLKIMANPWSPPGWMKSSGSMVGGSLLLNSTSETAFAGYFVKYIQAYAAAGISIDYISLQNEPLYLPQTIPAWVWTRRLRQRCFAITFCPL